jgi:hypothetical protein
MSDALKLLRITHRKKGSARKARLLQYFLNFAPLKPDIIMLICNGNSNLLGGK